MQKYIQLSEKTWDAENKVKHKYKYCSLKRKVSANIKNRFVVQLQLFNLLKKKIYLCGNYKIILKIFIKERIKIKLFILSLLLKRK